MNPVLKKNFAVFSVLDWIATRTAHIPNKGEQLVRYYGYYSNVSRGKRKKQKPEEKTSPLTAIRRRMSSLVRKSGRS
jgi:Putative transposase